MCAAQSKRRAPGWTRYDGGPAACGAVGVDQRRGRGAACGASTPVGSQLRGLNHACMMQQETKMFGSCHRLTSNFEAVLLYYSTKSEVSSTSSTFLPSPPTPCHRRRCRCCCRRRTRRQTSFTLGPSSVASRYRAHGARCRHSPILHCCFPLLMRYYYTVLHTIAAGVHMSTNTTVIN